MRTLKISLCFLIITALTACSVGEFRNIVSFIDIYNEISPYPISLSDFIIADENKNEYVLLKDGMILSISEDNDGKINTLRMIIRKSDIDDSKKIETYTENLKSVIKAYCGYNNEETEEIIKAFSLNDKNAIDKSCELTLKKSNFYFIYYSNEISSEVRITNTYLQKIEPTEKPESKPFYGENFIEKD